MTGDRKKSKGDEDLPTVSCPKCKCCRNLFPCFFCFHPDNLLNRDQLIAQMRAIHKHGQVNIKLIDDQMQADFERQQVHKQRWRLRWTVCCCLFFVIGGVGAVIFILIRASSSWTVVNLKCDWGPRKHFGAVFTPSKKVIVAGGTDTTKNYADVWESADKGKNWGQLSDQAPFGPRHGHVLICDNSNGELFIIGGDRGGAGGAQPELLRDVWKSPDAREWKAQTLRAPWPARKYMGATIEKGGHIYLIGGISNYGTSGFNDMWRSEDRGRTWLSVSHASAWSARHSFAFTRLPAGSRAGRLYILGGNDGRLQYDVWATDNKGGTWFRMRFTIKVDKSHRSFHDRAPWSAREDMRAVADGHGKLTLVGGKADSGFTNEVWTLESPKSDAAWYERAGLTRDPLEWTEEGTPPWTPRSGHELIVDDEGVANILGGQDERGLKNDMWKFSGSIDLGNLQSAFDRTASAAATSGGTPASITTSTSPSTGGTNLSTNNTSSSNRTPVNNQSGGNSSGNVSNNVSGNAPCIASGNVSDNASSDVSDNVSSNVFGNEFNNACEKAAGNAIVNANGNGTRNASGNGTRNTSGNGTGNASSLSSRRLRASLETGVAGIVR